MFLFLSNFLAGLKSTGPLFLAELDHFRIQATSLLCICAERLRQHNSEENRVGRTSELLLAASPFDTAESWTTTESREAAREVIAVLATVHGLGSSEELVTSKASDFLELFKPLFAPHGSKRVVPVPRKSSDWTESEDGSTDAAGWEKLPGVKYAFLWVLTRLDGPFLNDNIALVAPPVFRLLEDYRVPAKIVGLHCVALFLSRVGPSVLKKSGLGLAFLSASRKSLHFRELRLLEVAYPCLFQLINLLDGSQTPESVAKLDELFLGLLKEGEFEEKAAFRAVCSSLTFLLLR